MSLFKAVMTAVDAETPRPCANTLNFVRHEERYNAKPQRRRRPKVGLGAGARYPAPAPFPREGAVPRVGCIWGMVGIACGEILTSL